MSDSEYQKKDVVTIVLHSINDTQNVIKNVDTKAQVVVGVIAVLLVNVEKYAGLNPAVIFCVFFSSLSILFGFLVIAPRMRKSTTYNNSYFVSPHQSADDLSENVIRVNWTKDLYEVLLNLVKIREEKLFYLHLTLCFSALAVVSSIIGYIIKVCADVAVG